MVPQELLLFCLTLTQEGLKDFIEDYLKEDYEVLSTEYGIIAKNKHVKALPLTLVAHLDTINDHDDKILYREDIEVDDSIISVKHGVNKVLGADCRAGVALALQFSKDADPLNKPHLVFPLDEEIGCKGAKGLVSEYSNDLESVVNTLAVIELDRMNGNDYATYQYENVSSHPIIQKLESLGYEEKRGSSTDIVQFDSLINSLKDTAVFNLSIGYKDQHSPDEILDLEQYEQAYNTLMDLNK